MDDNVITEFSKTAMAMISTYGLQVLGAIAILIIGRIAAAIGGRMARRALERGRADSTLIGFFTSLVRAAIMVFAVIAALQKFGLQTTSFVAVLGAAGLAVGLALQGSLSNFAAGVLLLVFRPFKLGDAVEAGGVAGSVAEIGIFTTTINSWDNKKIIVPNAQITGGTIVNINAHPTRRVDMTAGIGYGDDIGRAKEVLEGILARHPKVLEEPAPVVQVSELGDSSINFVVRPWAKNTDYWAVYFDVQRAIKEEFDAQGISIPFPQRDVHLYPVSGAETAAGAGS
jgi:small conductance mechanosensitive channel